MHVVGASSVHVFRVVHSLDWAELFMSQVERLTVLDLFIPEEVVEAADKKYGIGLLDCFV